MKSCSGVWDQLARLDTFLEAFHRAAKGKAATVEVAGFRRNLHDNVSRMLERLVANRYPFGPYHAFMVWDPKPRCIRVAPFEQRVMHHAIMIACGGALERSLIFDSYACRKGKGQHAAATRAHAFAKRFAWYLKMDVEKFYDRLPHERLLELLSRRFRERRVMRLLIELVASYESEPGRGLLIGNLTSQYFANFYLDGFDHWIKETCGVRGHVRYMDDMLLFGNSPEELRILRGRSTAWLHAERGLTVKHGGEINRVDRGVPFVGFTIRPQGIRLHRRSACRYSRKLGALKRAFRQGRCGERELQRRGQALVAATLLAGAGGFRLNVEARQKEIVGYA